MTIHTNRRHAPTQGGGKPQVHVLFTMNCLPRSQKRTRDRPNSWEWSARCIEGYCDVLLREGYRPTLFLTPPCAEQHEPMLLELQERGAELALLVEPRAMDVGGSKKPLGRCREDEQRQLIERATEQVRQALDVRPRSLRCGGFSADDATYEVAYELGFRQGSLSSPGRDLPGDGARWLGARRDAHYVDPNDRLAAGALPFFEVPVTTDVEHIYARGIPFELCIEHGNADAFQRPLIEEELERSPEGEPALRTLCFYTSNVIPYFDRKDMHAETLANVLEYLDTLRAQYELVPSTLVGAHESFLRVPAT